MQGILDALNVIIKFINTAVDLVSMTIKYIFVFIQILFSALGAIGFAIYYLPPMIQAFASISIVICIIYFIIGRNKS